MSDIILRQGGLSRRELLHWMAAAGFAATSGASLSGNLAGPTGSVGYGTDPVLVDPPRQPWPRILVGKQVSALTELVDAVLPASDTSPAASEVGVVMFFEEWLSAPYPGQLDDRALLLPLIDKRVAGAPLDTLQSGDAWERFRLLTGSAYYTTPVGMREMGFVGNIPLREFKGPPAEVLAMLDARYEALN